MPAFRLRPRNSRRMICHYSLIELDQLWDLAPEPVLRQVRNYSGPAISRWRAKRRRERWGTWRIPGYNGRCRPRLAIRIKWCNAPQGGRCA